MCKPSDVWEVKVVALICAMALANEPVSVADVLEDIRETQAQERKVGSFRLGCVKTRDPDLLFLVFFLISF